MSVEIEGTASWQHCPICGSDRIEGHTFEVDGMSAWQLVTCQTCGADWNEVYQAVGRDNINTALCVVTVKVMGHASDNDTLANRVVSALSVVDDIEGVIVES